MRPTTTPAPSGSDVTVILAEAGTPEMAGGELERLRASHAGDLAYGLAGETGLLIGWSGFHDRLPAQFAGEPGDAFDAAIIGHHAAPVGAGAEASS